MESYLDGFYAALDDFERRVPGWSLTPMAGTANAVGNARHRSRYRADHRANHRADHRADVEVTLNAKGYSAATKSTTRHMRFEKCMLYVLGALDVVLVSAEPSFPTHL